MTNLMKAESVLVENITMKKRALIIIIANVTIILIITDAVVSNTIIYNFTVAYLQQCPNILQFAP
jgi:hypothetical protein